MTTTCKYCNEPENKQTRPGLICECCICFVHLSCLRRPGTPGDFTCDVFFDFTCEDCSPEKREVFIRNKFPWVNVILLTLYHLSTQSYGISNHGFFHYKTHICSFIDRHWHLLFGVQFKQKKNWVGTIAGSLSVYNNLIFRSGSAALGETGWWRLQHAFSPAVAAHIIQEMARDKPKGRPRNQMALDRAHFIAKVTVMGYKDLVHDESDLLPLPGLEPAVKKRRVESDDSSTSYYEHIDSDSRAETLEELVAEETAPRARDGGYSDVEGAFRGFEFTPVAYAPPSGFMSDTSSIHSLQQATLYYESDSPSDGDQKPEAKAETRRKLEEKPVVRRESLFSTELNSTELPWLEPPQEERKDLVELTPYEELQLLKQVEALVPKARDPQKRAQLARLRAKLALRRLKRHKHLPVFDLDKTVKLLGGYVTEDPKVALNAERILDRFQRSYLIDNLSGTIASTNYGTLLLSHCEPAPFRSPYSGALLKPYIRQDRGRRRGSAPLWLRLTDELLRATHKDEPRWAPPPAASLDYAYVRPHHIAAVNSLCAQFFWPGVDLTEALEYPEFSCVVSYKKLVVGFAFLVPRANEAYVSFILTRPEWRRAGIAEFMLYHLLQTCTGKDVTLHVSPTNPAIFMYQKFGFKVEELIQDFYEKYFDIDYKGCRHALFLRLVR